LVHLSWQLEKFWNSPSFPLKGGDIFDCVLAVNARDNEIDVIYTQNLRDFNPSPFLGAVNPLKGK
jgi:hypothetical protein